MWGRAESFVAAQVRIPAEERRWTTVVFADLSGFTALSERMDPEDVRSLIDGCMAKMGEIVSHFGGSVDKVVGDELMALFGAPTAHGDDAERAVRAASKCTAAPLSTPRILGPCPCASG